MFDWERVVVVVWSRGREKETRDRIKTRVEERAKMRESLGEVSLPLLFSSFSSLFSLSLSLSLSSPLPSSPVFQRQLGEGTRRLDHKCYIAAFHKIKDNIKYEFNIVCLFFFYTVNIVCLYILILIHIYIIFPLLMYM